jgi:hypothetical protein
MLMVRMAGRNFQWHAVRVSIAATLLSLCALASAAGRAGNTDMSEFVKTPRVPLPGVVVEGQSDGAIVRSNGPSFADAVKKTLGASAGTIDLLSQRRHAAESRGV